MTRPSLIVIVSGPPGTGKTTLARAIADELGLPLFHKDRFKELLFDELDGPEYASREFSRRLGRSTIRFLMAIMEELARSGMPAVVEANFHSELFSPFARDLAGRYPVRYVRVHLTCEEDVRRARCLARESSGERHPGHRGLQHGGPRPLEPGDVQPLDVDGVLIPLDTTDFGNVDYAPVIAKIASLLPD